MTSSQPQQAQRRATPQSQQKQSQQQPKQKTTPSQLILQSNLRHASDSTPLTANLPKSDAELSHIIKELNMTPQRQSAMYANMQINAGGSTPSASLVSTPASSSSSNRSPAGGGVDVLQTSRQQQSKFITTMEDFLASFRYFVLTCSWFERRWLLYFCRMS